MSGSRYETKLLTYSCPSYHNIFPYLIHLTFGRLEFDDVSRQVGVAIVGCLPAQLHRATSLVNNLEAVWRLWFLLDDQVDARVITAKGVGSHTGK